MAHVSSGLQTTGHHSACVPPVGDSGDARGYCSGRISMSCECKTIDHEPHLVVLTGGPGAGKTAVLEIVRRYFCAQVQIVPEAAGKRNAA